MKSPDGAPTLDLVSGNLKHPTTGSRPDPDARKDPRIPPTSTPTDRASSAVSRCTGWLQLRGEAPEARRIGNDRPLALTHNLGGYPGEMVSFVSIVGRERA